MQNKQEFVVQLKAKRLIHSIQRFILKTLWCFQRKPVLIGYIDGGLCKANKQAVFPLYCSLAAAS